MPAWSIRCAVSIVDETALQGALGTTTSPTPFMTKNRFRQTSVPRFAQLTTSAETMPPIYVG